MVLTEQRIGIIGAGHLGLAVAVALVDRGLDKKCLHISHGTRAETRAHIVAVGLEDCMAADNVQICRNSDMVLIALKPNSVGPETLEGLPFHDEQTVISTVAGVPISRLEALCGVPVNRVMLSGPDSIRRGTGLGAFFPDDGAAKDFLALLGVTAYPLRDEEDFHLFTAAMCLPSAYLQIEISGSRGDTNLNGAYTDVLPFWDELVAWSRRAVPDGFCKDEKLAYISAMATKGGVTEAIVGGIAAGMPLAEAFECGVKHSREIAAANGV